MKKLLITLTAIFIFIACKNEPEIKDYATLSGKILNSSSDELKIINRQNQLVKTLVINDDGSFKDTLKVNNGVYSLTDGKDYVALYLENNFDIAVSLDIESIDESISFTGNGSDGSSYLAKKMLLQEQAFNNINDIYALEKAEFINVLDKKKADFANLKEQYKNLDSTFIAEDHIDTEGLFNFLTSNYERLAKKTKLIGMPSPKFSNYENYKGGTTSLDDLKGKYVYVDVWATWCGPCKREIPYLKEVEKEFHGKNIEFVSISVDKIGAYEAWKKMIVDEKLGGIQLFAGDDLEFVTGYNIEGIPRFILIDDKGNIVNPDAPRPSNPALKDLLNSLNI